MSEQRIPIEEFNANLRSLGRGLADAQVMGKSWVGEEYGLELAWPDGFWAWVSFGAAASALVERVLHSKARLH
ncbi:MAG TPA: hypothetical protein VD865_02835 [Stenotrophomonas sp.]|nr:hypothetical protein [Stenotrophomonas sp.]